MGSFACNTRVEALVGPRGAAGGKTDYDFFQLAGGRWLPGGDLAAIHAGCAVRSEMEVVFAADGHREQLEVIRTPMVDDNGRLIGVLAVARDVTETRAMQAALRDREEIFSSIVGQAGDSIAVVDARTGSSSSSTRPTATWATAAPSLPGCRSARSTACWTMRCRAAGADEHAGRARPRKPPAAPQRPGL